MATAANRPDLQLAPPPAPESPSALSPARKRLLLAAGAVLATAAVIVPPLPSIKFGEAQDAARPDQDNTPAHVAIPVTTGLVEGESPWETAARDLASAREGDPAPTDAQVMQGTELLEAKNKWTSAEEAKAGRILGLTPDERADILDGKPIAPAKPE